MRDFKVYEDMEQEALFEWAEISSRRYPELSLMFHIPNGGKRDELTAVKLKRQGVKRGVPDICLPVSRGKYHGLFVELKVPNGGVVSRVQEDYLDALNKNGYFAVVCYGWIEAARTIGAYVTGGIK